MKEEILQSSAIMAKKLEKKRELLSNLDQFNAEKIRSNEPKKVIKFNAEEVLFIDKIGEKFVFLERGVQNEEKKQGAGYKHILTHAKEFKQNNISIAKLPYVLFSSLSKNNIIAYQGKGKGRPIFEAENEKIGIAITVGSNGYIVGANPTSKRNK